MALNQQVFALSVWARTDRPHEISKSCSHLQQANPVGWTPLHSSPCIHFPGLLLLSPATDVTAIKASWHRCACRRVARRIQRFCASVIGTWPQERCRSVSCTGVPMRARRNCALDGKRIATVRRGCSNWVGATGNKSVYSSAVTCQCPKRGKPQRTPWSGDTPSRQRIKRH